MFKPGESQITLAVNCYRVERFIKDAIAGALAQTYSPLEIIFSDDCSTDRTFELIQEAVKDYQGPHRIVLNRNPQNLGLARHQNRLFELATSDWIVFQAGDDISLPNRVTRIAQGITDNPQAVCLGSQVNVIDANGNPWGTMPSKPMREHRFLVHRITEILGATAAYNKKVFDEFGTLGQFAGNEDSILSLRSHLLGTIVNLPDVLVLYRKHGNNHSSDSSQAIPEIIAKIRLRRIYTLYQELIDLQTFVTKHPEQYRKVDAIRNQLNDDIYIQWLFGNWTIHHEQRPYLLGKVLSSPRAMWLIAKRVLNKLI